MHNDIITTEFTQALRDYAYLLNQNYPRKSMLKIVGDRYLLNTYQRILLSRGVFPNKSIHARFEKSTEQIYGEDIHIDTYNVLFTISNYLLGRIVFICNDLFIRDAGEVYGKLNKNPVFSRSIELLFSFLERGKPLSVKFHIDSPVSHSAELAGTLRNLLSGEGIPGDSCLERNPDAELIKLDSGIVASSDSDVLDQTGMRVVDLAHLVLKNNFSPDLPDLTRLLS